MKTNALLKLRSILMLALFAVIGGAVFYFLLLPKFQQNNSIQTLSDNLFGWKYPSVKFPITGSNQLAYSDIRDPGGIPQGLPVRLQIPTIGVDAAIEDALITPDGRMDVPAGSTDVAWFALGPHPGQVGSAVIGGHFGIQNGVPFVFYKLDTLKVGDKVYVVDDKGNTLAFIVRKIELFDRNADATPVFTSSDGLAHLNLITCEGIWNQVNGNYPQRRVVFTDAVPLEGVIIPKIQPVSVFSRLLSLGMRGTDVAALQTALEQKGFLIMPRGIAKGYYGAVTRTAVAKYQKSVGLPATGIFNSLTRAKLVLTPPPVSPSLPITSLTPQSTTPLQTPISYQPFTQYIESLFGTPTDALVTSLLLILIIFVLFKIFKKK